MFNNSDNESYMVVLDLTTFLWWDFFFLLASLKLLENFHPPLENIWQNGLHSVAIWVQI